MTIDTKTRARELVERGITDAIALSGDLHEHPELSFEEHHAAQRVGDALCAAGFAVETPVGGLPTALSGRAGTGPLVVAICAEYDALPGVGHACGHNLIAASAVAAGSALVPLVDDLGITVVVVGTPAEEGGGGKILLLDEGVFDGVHAAMMVHPWPEDRLEATCLAVAHQVVRYHGKSAHASAAPYRGINAADALTIAQVAIGLLRQHLHPGDQVHGIVTKGGDAPNVVPAEVTGQFMVRARSLEELAVLEPRIRRCFEAGALATGAELEIEMLSPRYSELHSDDGLLAAWRLNAEALGRRYDADDAGVPLPTLSTDMANISLTIPTIHPLIGLDARGAVNHQPAFAEACVGPSADRALADGAIAMAWTAIDAATTGELRDHLLNQKS